MLSKLVILLIILTLSGVRLTYGTWEKQHVPNVLTWDAFGYYLYLPGYFIYHDIKKMEWVPHIAEKYQATGSIYQLSKPLDNGNKAIKYLMGVSLMYSPFFLAGHSAAKWFDYPQDGFSYPYQLAIIFSAIFYSLMGFIALRWVLLQFYSDFITAITLLLIALATNYLQYVSIDSAMSHGYIFTLYAFLLAATIRWHAKPSIIIAFFIGAIIGLGIISRPTEIVMIFIPLLFKTHNNEEKSAKWKLVSQNKSHAITLVFGGITGLFPQLIYWKTVSGNWIYDVGSKWTFLQPNWQVLFGWEKGWLIYTPIVFFMILGLFFIRKNPFYWSVLIYFLLNIWIVTSWDDWRYGASYSCRALVQSYAVMAIPLGMIVQKVLNTRIKYMVLLLFAYLTCVNLFQIWQYNKGIIHYNDMNRQYYQAIYLNPHPSPLQMSLLDTKEFLTHANSFKLVHEITIDSQFTVNAANRPKYLIYNNNIHNIPGFIQNKDQWLMISGEVLSAWGAFETNLVTTLAYSGMTKSTYCRMQNGVSQNMEWNLIAYYFKVPRELSNGELNIFVETNVIQDIFIKDVQIRLFQK